MDSERNGVYSYRRMLILIPLPLVDFDGDAPLESSAANGNIVNLKRRPGGREEFGRCILPSVPCLRAKGTTEVLSDRVLWAPMTMSGYLYRTEMESTAH